MTAHSDSIVDSIAVRRDPRLALAIAALIGACVLIVVLGWQNRGLRAAERAAADRAELPFVGMFVPIATARALDGTPRTLGAPARGRQILYFYTPTCPYCRASVPAVRALAERAAGGELIGVGQGTPDELRAHAQASGFGFPIVELLDDRARALYRSRDVPLVLVVDGEGRVHYQRVGQLGTGDLDEILAAAAIPAGPAARSPSTGVTP